MGGRLSGCELSNWWLRTQRLPCVIDALQAGAGGGSGGGDPRHAPCAGAGWGKGWEGPGKGGRR